MLTLLALLACKKDEDTGKPSSYLEDFTFRAQVGENLRDVGDRADRVVAIPHARGVVGMESMTPVVGSIGDDGSFELTLSSKSDWAIFLVDSAATDPRDRVVATVELGLDDASMVSVVGETVTGDIDAGTLVEGDGTATSSTTSAEVASWFGTSSELVDLIGAADDAQRSLANAAANYEEGGAWFWARSTFSWKAPFTWDGADTPPYAYAGWSLQVVGRDSGLNADALRAGTQVATLHPPSELVMGGQTYGPEAPLSLQWVDEKEGQIAITFSEVESMWESPEPLSDIPEGWWSLRVDGVEVAAFELSVSTPVAEDGVPIGVFPIFRYAGETTDHVPLPSGMEWRVRSASGEDLSPDPADLGAILWGSTVKLSAHSVSDGVVYEEITSERGAAPVTEVSFPEAWVSSNKAPEIGDDEPVFATAWVTTSLGDNGVSVIWYDLCPDSDGDGAPTCAEGQEADQWPTVYPGAWELCGDGLDNDMAEDGDRECLTSVDTLGLDLYPFIGLETGPAAHWMPLRVTVEDAGAAGLDLELGLSTFTDGTFCGVSFAPGFDGSMRMDAMGTGESTLVYAYASTRQNDSMCEPYVAPVDGAALGWNSVVALSGGSVVVDRHVAAELTERKASADATSLITGWELPADVQVGVPFEVVLTGRTRTTGLLWLSPTTDPYFPSWDLRLVGVDIQLVEVGTAAVPTVCLDPACLSSAEGSTAGQPAGWVAPGVYEWTATLRFSYLSGFDSGALSAVMYSEASDGSLRHTALDSTWASQPKLPLP